MASRQTLVLMQACMFALFQEDPMVAGILFLSDHTLHR